MANVDLRTGKIRGAKKGTAKYYHEVGHLKFEEDNRWGNLTRVTQELSLRTLIFAIAFQVLHANPVTYWLIVAGLMANIVSEGYEESWCNSYAEEKMEEIKKRDDKKFKSKKI